jgi:aminopeptidase
MSINDFTFCNSLVARNVPGSEVFSGVQRESVEGTVVAKGLFHYNGSDIIQNLTMKFNKGVLSDWHADKGQDIFEKIINKDEGARRIGELGIGTNPHLKRHSCNGLLVEKISGSFHLALGGSYEMTKYMDKPVIVDNGNRSDIHWDITTMLYGKEGKIIVDGITVMDDGLFLDERLMVLNSGWEALTPDERPDYWKDYDFEAHRKAQLSVRNPAP